MGRLSSILAVILFFTATSSAQQPDLNQLKREAVSEVDSMQALTQQMVDEIFSYAELGFQEHNTSRYVTGILEKNGFAVQRGVAGIPTAWVATWGSGKPVIAFITDIDGIPQASQKPGVAYHDPLVPGAPGHGEGHNSGQAVNVTAALSLKKIMQQHHLAGTLKLFPGVAEELLGAKAFYIREAGLVSVQYFFHGKAAHAAVAPWEGRSALDAVELMDVGWNFRREHLRLEQRSHYVISNGGDQPNVVPPEASVWYYFRELDYPHIKDLYELGNKMAQAASMMTDTSVTQRLVGSAWPRHFNKVIAEVEHRNIEAVGMPEWAEADQILARAVQKEVGAKETGLKTKVEELRPNPTISGTSRGTYQRFICSIRRTFLTCRGIAGQVQSPWLLLSLTKALLQGRRRR